HTFSGNINVITKGGGNQFHGSLFEAAQNTAFNAKNAALRPTDPKPPVHVNQFGGSLGGPIQKYRLFFFCTYEGSRQSTTAIAAGRVPTASFKSELSPAQPRCKPILDFCPLPTQAIANNATVGLFQGLAAPSSSDNNIVAKGDYQMS